MNHRIDTHHHIVPPCWLAEEGPRMAATAVNFDFVAKWTAERSLEAMDRHGVATAVTSISTVIIRPDDPKGMQRLTRECNEYAARLAADHPGRFGTFALLPLPHVDLCLREIEYCTDVLKVDGFKLQTSYIDRWPGDPAFAPVFDEMNRRRSVVYFHPTVSVCCADMLPGIHAPLMEYPFDTTRAIASLLFSGTLTRCPNVSFLFSHGGGTMPMLAYRIVSLAEKNPALRARLPSGALSEIRRLYFDVVSVTNPPAMAALLKLMPVGQLLFGSDIPYVQFEETISGLAESGLNPEELRSIECDNALRLMPSLARRAAKAA